MYEIVARVSVPLLALGCLLLSAVAQGRIIYPVTISFTAESAPSPGCSACERYAGRVASPQPRCREHRRVLAVWRYPHNPVSYSRPLGLTDRSGRWSARFTTYEPTAAMTVLVKAKRLPSGTICHAAQATSRHRL